MLRSSRRARGGARRSEEARRGLAGVRVQVELLAIGANQLRTGGSRHRAALREGGGHAAFSIVFYRGSSRSYNTSRRTG